MWIPVTERLPDPYVRVDVWRRGFGRVADCYCDRLEATRNGVPYGSWHDTSFRRVGGASITHWREIPKSPEEEREHAAFIGP